MNVSSDKTFAALLESKVFTVYTAAKTVKVKVVLMNINCQ